MPACPNCKYIGKPSNCSCMFTIRKVVEGQGTDPAVVKNAENILKASAR